MDQPFVWKKKEELDKSYRKRQREKTKELDAELIKVREQRAKGLAEREKRMAEKDEVRRMEDSMKYVDWERKGDELELQQIKVRREERFKNGRQRVADVFSRNLDYAADRDDVAVETHDPVSMLNCLRLGELEEFVEAAELFIRMNEDMVYWRAAMAIAKFRIKQLTEKTDEFAGINVAVMRETIKDLQTMPLEEVLKVESDAKERATNPRHDSDQEFWQQLRPHFIVAKARCVVREYHKEAVEKWRANKKRKVDEDREAKRQTAGAAAHDEDLEGDAEGDGPNYSPKIYRGEDAQEDDTEEIRARVLRQHAEAGSRGTEGLPAQHDTSEFTEEAPTQVMHQSWHDKYRPRKPKYFNRVHTGFEWNKYNQTHYDAENPPPKVVMGYKFNIFYPDLVNPNQQPTWYVEPTEQGWDDDVCIIRFHAGPPYEDIAFKIVNKAWNTNLRSGFKCTFERGVLHLYFNLTRMRYRR